MARQYTAWVIQDGKGDDAVYVTHFHTYYQGNANVSEWHHNPSKALQFARRSDARRLQTDCDIAGRPVEKQFG